MENRYSHAGAIHYKLDVSLQDNILELTLTIGQEKKVRKFKDFLIDDSLPKKIKEEFKTVKNLFIVLERRKNFKVDPLRGQIIVSVKKMELNEPVEQEAEIQLNFVGEEEEEKEKVMESNIYEEFGGEIE